MRKPKQLNNFYAISLGIFVLLALIRLVFPSVMKTPVAHDQQPMISRAIVESVDEVAVPEAKHDEEAVLSPLPADDSHMKWHRVYSVPGFDQCFPDSQAVQYASARKWGVTPPDNREEAERRKGELVYVGSSPYFHVDASMTSAIPYLVPRASDLLNRIGRNFFDSLYVKNKPLHKILVTSVLRSNDEVKKLMQHNVNATEKSCHRFGTTFDISYVTFYHVRPRKGPDTREVPNDTLKWILSEVLRDLREEGACWVKYEKLQSCFHITVR